jgi:UDP-glucose 4-epimerase
MNTLKKVLVTGGAGFIGSHIVDALLADGHEVHIVDNLSTGKKENCNKDAVFHLADITDGPSLESIFTGIDTIFHTAALPRVPLSIEHPLETNHANITGTLTVLHAAHKAGVRRVIYSASSSAYGEQQAPKMKESFEAKPLHPYGIQKYVGELYCRIFSSIYGLQTVSLRYFNIYGPRQDPNGSYAGVIAKFAKLTKEGQPLPIIGDGTQTRDFTHVYDAVRANLLAMDSINVGQGEVINVGGGQSISIQALAKIFGGETISLPARPEAKDSCADITRAKELLDWEPKEELEKAIAVLLQSI